jgi:hypothetical protein
MDFRRVLDRIYADEYEQQATVGRHRFAVAGPFWCFVLNRFGFAAITTPWRAIYMLPQYFDHARLRRHELAHIAQIDRDGAWYFWPKICFDYVWHGYKNSPYELEARAAEDDQLDMFETTT